MPLDPDGKDFLLHLYDKLWENMASKEGRLWNYLSVYGAAVALAAGVGQYAGVESFSVFIVFALTAWALIIVVNANWWYQRNRLMVTQIEAKFAAVGALDGVVPKSYRDARFEIDRLYRASAIILAAIASLLYLKVLWQHKLCGFRGVDDVCAIGLLYVFFLGGIAYCISQHESYIASFYFTKRDLLREAGIMTEAEIETNIQQGRGSAYKSYSWKVYGILFLIFGMASFDLLPGRSSIQKNCLTALGLFLQLCVVGLYLLISGIPARNARWWRRTWLVQIIGTVILITSAAALLVVPYKLLASGGTFPRTPQCQAVDRSAAKP